MSGFSRTVLEAGDDVGNRQTSDFSPASHISDRKHRFRKHEVRRGKTRRRHLLLTAMALEAGSLLAEVAGSMFCPLTLSRRLLQCASPALPAADAHRQGGSNKKISVMSGFNRTVHMSSASFIRR